MKNWAKSTLSVLFVRRANLSLFPTAADDTHTHKHTLSSSDVHTSAPCAHTRVMPERRTYETTAALALPTNAGGGNLRILAVSLPFSSIHCEFSLRFLIKECTFIYIGITSFTGTFAPVFLLFSSLMFSTSPHQKTVAGVDP